MYRTHDRKCAAGYNTPELFYRELYDLAGGLLCNLVRIYLMILFDGDICGIFQMSGIDTILPKSVIDDYLFEPCGYSANGIMPNVSTE